MCRSKCIAQNPRMRVSTDPHLITSVLFLTSARAEWHLIDKPAAVGTAAGTVQFELSIVTDPNARVSAPVLAFLVARCRWRKLLWERKRARNETHSENEDSGGDTHDVCAKKKRKRSIE